MLGGGLLGGRGLARFFNTRPAQQEPEPSLHARRVILVGIDQFTATVIKLTDCQKPRTTRIVSVLDARDRYRGRTIVGVPVVGRFEDLVGIIDEFSIHGVDIDEVWNADKSLSGSVLARLEQECNSRGVKIAPIDSVLNLEADHGRKAGRIPTWI